MSQDHKFTTQGYAKSTISMVFLANAVLKQESRVSEMTETLIWVGPIYSWNSNGVGKYQHGEASVHSGDVGNAPFSFPILNRKKLHLGLGPGPGPVVSLFSLCDDVSKADPLGLTRLHHPRCTVHLRFILWLLK